MRTSLFITLALGLLAGCASDDDSFTTNPFPVDLGTASDSNVSSGTFSKSKAINESDLKDAVDDATTAFGNVPSGFQVVSAKLDLDPAPSSISGYEQIFTGPITFFLSPGTGIAVDVGTVEEYSGNEPIEFDITAEPEAYAANLSDFLEGNFDVGVRAAAGGASAVDFTAALALEVKFELIP